jgi:hypothetical protein
LSLHQNNIIIGTTAATSTYARKRKKRKPKTITIMEGEHHPTVSVSPPVTEVEPAADAGEEQSSSPPQHQSTEEEEEEEEDVEVAEDKGVCDIELE